MDATTELSWLWVGAIALGALIATYGLVGWLVRCAENIGLLDRPNERSSHTQVTPRGGGAAIVLVWLVGIVVAETKFFPKSAAPALMIAGAAALVAAVSLWDDFRSLSAAVRLAVHASAAVVAVWAIAGTPTQPRELLIFGGAVVGVVGLTNIFNFMDGIDGIAGLQALASAAAGVLAGMLLGNEAVVISSALLMGGAAGFLVHNWSPARIFMGDVGSAFCGFVFATTCVALAAIYATEGGRDPVRPLIAGILLVGPFIGDGVVTVLARLCRSEAIWKPHRSHFYQRFVRAGWSHAHTALYYGAWAVLTAGVAVAIWRGASCWWGSVEGAFLLVTWRLVLRAERWQRRGAAGNR